LRRRRRRRMKRRTTRMKRMRKTSLKMRDGGAMERIVAERDGRGGDWAEDVGEGDQRTEEHERREE